MRVKVQNEIMVGCYQYITYKNHSYIFKIDLHATFAAPDEYENKLPPHPGPLPRRGEGKKNKRIQSSFSLDGRR
ncbi:hypothetical protein RT761_01006 [Atribacter laminatus]|uniref:Uncharacterized protein n=1 Tax=Atribacter laminatus TaxID=2847778 RepID=A0A7T1AKW4_ATRLM|nr:hypothetical protein RT761_01006 [Atribacter laminatus]